MSDKPVAAGKSSFDLLDRERTFAIIDLKPNSSFLDLACGIGRYSLAIGRSIGDQGTVYAVDLWQEGIEALKQKIAAQNIKNIKAILADITKQLPLEDNSIDSCLMATILHDIPESDRNSTMQEVSRVVKPGGMLNIIEFKKIDKGPGPPISIRMAEEDLEALVARHGFMKVAGSEVGEYNYLIKYKKKLHNN